MKIYIKMCILSGVNLTNYRKLDDSLMRAKDKGKYYYYECYEIIVYVICLVIGYTYTTI